MSMQSLQLLPALQKLPAVDGRKRSARESIEDLIKTDPATRSAELAASVSFGMWGIWDQVNVDDTLAQAYATQYPGLAADHSLHQHLLDMTDQGPESVQGFINGLKGKVAGFNFAETLKDDGFTNVSIAPDPTQPGWDISAIGPDGQAVLWQVKTGAEEYAGQVMDAMRDNPFIDFAVSSEIFDRIAERSPELIDRLTEIGSTIELEGTVNEGLDILKSNLGIDVPDSIGDILPYAGAILAGARLVYGVIRTEQQFKAVDRTTRNKIHVIQTLTLMSRMGVTTVMSAVGGMGGSAIGTAVPIIGNAIGGITGTVAGVGMGMYLNRHLQPHMLNLALDITGLTNDDLFYFKNVIHIDQVALSFRQTSHALTAIPTSR